MKIQEMRSGIPHLTRRLEATRRVELRAVEIRKSALADDLDKRRWSVISVEGCEAGSLTYHEAAILLAKLVSSGIAGLCIVTDDAARRMKPKIERRVPFANFASTA